MSLRSRLIVAFLLLSVVPLSAVTFITYRSWVATFEKAAQREAAQSAGDIGRRMERITADVGRRMDRMLVEARSAGNAPESAAMRQRVAPMLGDAAALVERVEFTPMGPRPQGPPPPDAPAPPDAPSPRGDASAQRRGGAPMPPWIGPDGQPRFPSPGRVGRGRGGTPWGRNGAPPPDPQVIVVDVEQAVEDARRLAAAEAAGVAPGVEESLAAALPAAQAALKSAAATAASATGDAASAAARQMEMQVAGRRVEIAVTQDGQVVGKAHAMLNLDRTLRTAFAFSRRDLGEIPFAIDTSGVLHNPDPDDRRTLESFGAAALGPAAAADGRARRAGDWLIVSRKDPSGLIFGIARPIGESLREIRRAAMRNLGLGLLAIVLALIGIVPISHGMTRDLTSLDAGVRELAAGNFQARVPVRSKDEFGSLATAFNQMAADLERHQALVLEQERLRRELELSRLIQSEMLPRAPLRLGAAEIKGISIPAREVGGDFFNYFALPDGRLALLVGDVSGKGVSAALLMANVQATLRARLPLESDLARLAEQLDREFD
jgi:HAMP domain-containing protein